MAMWSWFWSTMASAITFEQDTHIPCASFLSTFSLHEGMAHAVGLPFELHEPAVWTMRSMAAAAIWSSPKTVPQRENSMFVVITTDCRLRASANI